MQIVILHADTKQEVDADVFETVTYFLHESFGEKAKQGESIVDYLRSITPTAEDYAAKRLLI